MTSQVGLRKQLYIQSWWRGWIPAELFQILRDDAVKVLHSTCQQIWKTQQWPQDWKSSVFIPIPKKGNAKECLNYHTIALISHTSKAMLKIEPKPENCHNPPPHTHTELSLLLTSYLSLVYLLQSLNQ